MAATKPGWWDSFKTPTAYANYNEDALLDAKKDPSFNIDVLFGPPGLQTTALMTMCRKGNIGAVRVLLKHGADPGFVNPQGQTALLAACALKDAKATDIVAELLQKNPNLDLDHVDDINQRPALYLAINAVDAPLVQRLIQAGASTKGTESAVECLKRAKFKQRMASQIVQLVDEKSSLERTADLMLQMGKLFFELIQHLIVNVVAIELVGNLLRMLMETSIGQEVFEAQKDDTVKQILMGRNGKTMASKLAAHIHAEDYAKKEAEATEKAAKDKELVDQLAAAKSVQEKERLEQDRQKLEFGEDPDIVDVNKQSPYDDDHEYHTDDFAQEDASRTLKHRKMLKRSRIKAMQERRVKGEAAYVHDMKSFINYAQKLGLSHAFPQDAHTVESVLSGLLEFRKSDHHLNKKEYLNGLIALNLYRVTLFCDDSGSMGWPLFRGATESRRDALLRAAKGITDVCTLLTPKLNGIRLRLINSNSHNRHPNIYDNVKVDNVTNVLSGHLMKGGTALGSRFFSKVITPIVQVSLDKAIASGSERPPDSVDLPDSTSKVYLERPELIVVITDGSPDSVEEEDLFINVISNARDKVNNEGFGQRAVCFVVMQIGDDEDAAQFLEKLYIRFAEHDEAQNVYICREQLSANWSEFNENAANLDAHLLKILSTPLCY